MYKDENKERKKQARKKGSAPLAPVCVNIEEEDENETILVKVIPNFSWKWPTFGHAFMMLVDIESCCLLSLGN